MTEGAAEHSANQRRGVVRRFDDRGVLAGLIEFDWCLVQQLSVLLWVEYMMFVVYWRDIRLRNNHFIMLYLFATVFYDLSHGDGRGIADLKRGLECDLRELDNASVRYFMVSIVSEYVII